MGDTLSGGDPVSAAKKAENDEKLAKMREEISPEPAESEEAESLAEDSATEDEQQVAEPEAEETEPDGETEPTAEAEDDLSEDDRRRLSQRAQTRFSKITKDNQELRAQNERLLNVVTTLQDEGYSRQEAEVMAPGIEEGLDENVTGDQYLAQVSKKAREIVRQEFQNQHREQQRRDQIDTFQSELEKVEQKYPELNAAKDNPQYDENLDTYISEQYLARSKTDPSIRLSQVADEIMDIRTSAVKKSSATTVDKVSKQAAEQAVPPSSTPGQAENPTEKFKGAKSLKELEKIRDETIGHV